MENKINFDDENDEIFTIYEGYLSVKVFMKKDVSKRKRLLGLTDFQKLLPKLEHRIKLEKMVLYLLTIEIRKR